MSMMCTLRSLSDDALARAGSDWSSLEDDDDIAETEIDKAWHGLHYLLTGSAWGGGFPLSFLVEGGREIGDDDGYGPPRVFTSQEVNAIAAALLAIDEKKLRARFDPAAMDAADIYPKIWAREGDDALPWLLEAFEDVRSFVASASEAGESLIVELS